MEGYSKTDVSTVPRKNFVFNTGTPIPPTPTDSVGVVGGTLTGYKFPQWRAFVRAHVDATTDMVAGRTEITDSPGFYSVIRVNNSTGVTDRWFNAAGGPHGGNVDIPVIGVISTTKADSEAAGAFYQRARNAMSTFKGSVFAAESRDAKRMMVTRGRQILNSIGPHQNRLKKRWYGKGSKRARLRLLADSWLELQFGWKPLFSDIASAVKALNNPRPQYSAVSGTGSDRIRVGRVSSTFTAGIGILHNVYEEHTECLVKYYGEVRGYADPSGAGFRQDFGLTAREFLPTVWEVIPWSFLVDYFTNVGQIVTAASYGGADFTWRAKVVRSRRVITRHSTGQPPINNATNSYIVLGSSPLSSQASNTSVNRTRAVVVPIPSLRWGIPSLEQGLNLAALAVSRRLRLFHT